MLADELGVFQARSALRPLLVGETDLSWEGMVGAENFETHLASKAARIAALSSGGGCKGHKWSVEELWAMPSFLP